MESLINLLHERNVILGLLAFVIVLLVIDLTFKLLKEIATRPRKTHARPISDYRKSEEEEENTESDRTLSPIGRLQYRRNAIMSETELKFYRNLLELLGDKYWVLTKVNLWEVARPVENSGWNKVSRKQADFVLCNPANGETVLVVELDDPSHNRAQAQKRDAEKDAILASAGVPLLRMNVDRVGDKAKIAREVGEKLREIFGMTRN